MDAKKKKIIYWVLTVLICLAMGSGGIAMLAHVQANMEGLAHLGYPAYFANILGLAKVLGVVALIGGDNFPVLKEWAYAGICFDTLSAAASHAFSGDGIPHVIAPLVFFAFTVTAYRLWKSGVT